MKEKLKLIPSKDGIHYMHGEDFVLCVKQAGELFTLPKNKKTPITLVISDKKMREAYNVRFGQYGDCTVHYEDSWHEHTLYGDADILASNLGLNGKSVWVKLYWEE